MKLPAGMYVKERRHWWWPFKVWGYRCLTHYEIFYNETDWHSHLLAKHNYKEVQK